MKTILFDLLSSQPAGTSKFHGGGEYIKVIFENLVKNYLDECVLIVFYNKENFIDNWIIELIEENKIRTYDIKNIKDIVYIFDNEKIDVYYSGLPYDLKNVNIPESVSIVGTIHGLRPVEKPVDQFGYLYRKESRYIINIIKEITHYEYKKNKKKYLEIINILDKIICDSEHTKYSICNYFPQISFEMIKVFYAPEKKTTIISNEKEDERKYILLLGGDRWIKNTYRAISAIEGLLDDNKLQEYNIIIVGKITDKIKKRINHIEKFELLDYVTSEDLEKLYKNCDFFIYPSLNEGFGLPPLEAMKYGKTCIVSAVTSLPEICGDAVYYVNPYDIYEIRNRILRATEEKIDKNLVYKQVEKVNKRQQEDLKRICEYIIE